MAAVSNLASEADAIKDAEAEVAYWQDHHAELLEHYSDHFVAVSRVDRNVITAQSDLTSLLEQLGLRNVEPADVWVRFVTADPRRLVR